MLFADLPEELRTGLEAKKVAVGRWPAGLKGLRQYNDFILLDLDDAVLEGILEAKGYTRTTVSNWFNRTAQSFIGNNEKCIALAKEALEIWEEQPAEESAPNEESTESQPVEESPDAEPQEDTEA